MPDLLDKQQSEALFTDTRWTGPRHQPAIRTSTSWLIARNLAPGVEREYREADSADELTLESAAAAQRCFLESIAHLEFEE